MLSICIILKHKVDFLFAMTKRSKIKEVLLFSNNSFQSFLKFLAIHILAMIVCSCPSLIRAKSNFFILVVNCISDE